ncbi:MAG: DNA recombination protein RmuC [Coriobacteriia bacterium]|nr:DNA recombination protein RmuC [Coriobacteriia bacterium]MCL2749831.1 DNA recombination protein RmuC [Coriobacteriia bacterium]
MEQVLLISVLVLVAFLLVVSIVALVQFAGLRKRLLGKDDDAAEAEKRALEARNAEQEMTARLLRENREEQAGLLRESREEQANSLGRFEESVSRQLAENREVVEKRLTLLQEGNEKKLEQMRLTVDEKLTETVERRFSESFLMISDRLEQVHRGLGEMQKLAGGVDDLRKVLSGVKTRGNLGEYQLGAILEQVLSPEQFISNAQVRKRSQERIEFAIKIPSKDADEADLLLPIDSKFPIEDYERLLVAYEEGNAESVTALSARLARQIKTFARSIRDKYINPPITTDFAIMFVPTEGLYAEVLRTPGLFEELQRDHRVTVVGPTNLVAFLSSLQMGFRTLAIEKRSSEVWKLLGSVKNEFSRYEVLLDNVQKKLDLASKEMEKVSTKTRTINRKLSKVQELPDAENLALPEPSEVEPEADVDELAED